MIIDKLLELSLAQAIAGNADTAILSTYSYDTGAGKANIGVPTEGKKLVVTVDTTVVGGSSGILIDIIQSATAALGTPDVLASITTAATPVAGTKVVELILPKNTKRYVGVQYTPKGSNTTAGALNAWIVCDTDNQTAYASGFSIS